VQVIDHHQERGVGTFSQPVHHSGRLLTRPIATRDRQVR
jgi:hypothetical protein